MSKIFAPYGSLDHAELAAKVGKGKTPSSLVDRMPSAEIASKVGGQAPSSGLSPYLGGEASVVRLNARV